MHSHREVRRRSAQCLASAYPLAPVQELESVIRADRGRQPHRLEVAVAVVPRVLAVDVVAEVGVQRESSVVVECVLVSPETVVSAWVPLEGVVSVRVASEIVESTGIPLKVVEYRQVSS